MAEKDYLSGEELYKYLHISKRKMKYLIENGYIPAVDTGKKTYRYRVVRRDAEQFKLKLESDPFLFAQLKGKFSSKGNVKKAEIEPTKENSVKVRQLLEKQWHFLPDALCADDICDLIGYSRSYVNDMLRKPNLFTVDAMGKRYCTKQSLIEYLSSIEVMSSFRQSEKYKQLLRQFNSANK